MKSLHQDVAILPALARALNSELSGANFLNAWSLSKNGKARELKLQFEKEGQPICFTFNTTHRCGLLFPDEYPLEMPGGAFPLFKRLKGVEAEGVFEHIRNRSLAIRFRDGSELVFLFYGPLSDVLLYSADAPPECYRSEIIKHRQMDPNTLNQPGEPLPVLEGPFHVVQHQRNAEPVLLAGNTDATGVYSSNDLLDVLQNFARLFFQVHHFLHTKSALEQKARQELKSLTAGVESIRAYLEQVVHEVSPGEMANILMANLHALQKGMTQADLFDFYRNQRVSISLKKELSPQDNAAKYYQKEKNRKGELDKKNEQMGLMLARMEELKKLLEHLDRAEDLKQLRKLAGKPEPAKQERQEEGFRQFNKDGFRILVGKNAANNDKLTLKEAHKNDLWLHARGVGGSHVVIKHKSGLAFPDPVIRYAAAIAAYYSNSRGSSLVPVSYTFKKFVRKPKGAETGQVQVEKEEVVLVEPWVPGT